MLFPDARIASPPAPARRDGLSLADALDRILQRGVSVQGNLTLGLADVELLFLDLRLLLGAVDTIWPEGRPPVLPVQPRLGPQELSTPTQQPAATHRGFVPVSEAPENAPARGALTGRPGKAASSPAQGLVRLVLTLVKLLHDVLEHQAVRRMEGGRLTDAQIEDVGTALFAQAEEIERLKQQFGFSDTDLSLDLGVPDGAL
jgi:hypothetical protein